MEVQSLTVNSNEFNNVVVLVDLPSIDTKNGPFRLVNNSLVFFCLYILSSYL